MTINCSLNNLFSTCSARAILQQIVLTNQSVQNNHQGIINVNINTILCYIIDARIRASEKESPVHSSFKVSNHKAEKHNSRFPSILSDQAKAIFDVELKMMNK